MYASAEWLSKRVAASHISFDNSGTGVYMLPVWYVLSTAGRRHMQARHAPREVATVTSCRVQLMTVHANAACVFVE